MKVVDVARSWVGRQFNPGVKEQCAAFVRAVFRQAGVPVGVASRPSDWRQTQGMPQGPAYANSFAGDEVGEKVSRIADLRPGDVLLWENTYGDFPAGTLTHVGLYIGDGEFVHRPTAARPVEKAALAGWWADCFSEGRRVPGASGSVPDEIQRLKLFAHGGKSRSYQDGRETTAAEVKLFLHDGKLGAVVNGRPVEVAGMTLDLAYRP